MPQYKLRTGDTIPALGFGTYNIPADKTQQVVEKALELGYRHLDAASIYLNEAGVGAAIKACGIPRQDLFITSKLHNGDQGENTTRPALEKSLEKLGLDYLDLYIVHWPMPSRDLYVPSYRKIVEAHEEGLVKHPGVSNFLPAHLRRVIDEVGTVPVVNQFEVHPSFSQPELREYCQELGIQVESYCPLGRGSDLQHPQVKAIAKAHDVSASQVVIAWHLAHELVAIPKSSSPERQIENLLATKVTLSSEEVSKLDQLDHLNVRICADPATYDNCQW